MTKTALLLLLVLCAAGTALLHGCAGQPKYKGPTSPHFDGVHFRNSVPADKSLLDIARFISTYPFRRETWPTEVENASFAPPPQITEGIALTYINHSSVLLQVDGVNVLTDPIWSERASPFSFAGPKRVRAPGLALDTLPPIDVILVSHNHYDHLDIDSLRALQSRGRNGPPLILTGLGNGPLLQKHGLDHFRLLDWWDSAEINGVTFTFTEVRHRSGRGLADQMKTLWGGFAVRSQSGQIYFAGDTGYGPHFRQTRERCGAFDLALIPIGAYRPRDFMGPLHLDPDDAVKAHRDLASQQSVAIHHGTFQLTYEGIEEPYQRLQAGLEKAAIPASAFRVLGFGESLTLSSAK
jgi:L-ascorbate metabolism protein UlaG (beta-lactamase superfamily)